MDIVHHRQTTAKLVVSVTLHAAMAATIAWFIANVTLDFGTIALPAIAFLVFAVWAALFLKDQSPVMSAFLWGGTIYIVDDGGTELNLTTQVGVAEHPSISGVVEAVIPGILFFSPAELRQFQPNYRYTQIPWTLDAITQAMNRQREHRLDWD